MNRVDLRPLGPVVAVALAVAAAHALHLADSWWAAISAFTVLQAGFRASISRGLLRIVGSACGAVLGVALGRFVSSEPMLFVLVVTLATWGGLYAALRFRYSYAWVLGLVTFAMVVSEALSVPSGLQHFAMERVANVMVGTLAAVLVSGLVGAAAERADAARMPSAWMPPDRAPVARHALRGALAVAVLATLGAMHDLQAFSQAMVTTIAVLIVPFAPMADDALTSVFQRMLQRLVGCFAAGIVALALLPWLDGHPIWCQIALAIGVWASGWFQRHAARHGYAAIQFGVAFLLVFVQDRGWTLDVTPTWHRFAGVSAGIGLLLVILWVFGWRGRRS